MIVNAMAETVIHPLFGLAAEFKTPEAVLAAARAVRAAGYRRIDAYSPFPVEGLAEALGYARTRVPLIVGFGGLFGACFGFFMLWYANVISYPWNVGGRPANSWEAFIPITFELGVLCASLSAAVGMLALNGLPMPYHPVFNIPSFSLASRDKFFLVIESSDEKFDYNAVRTLLQALGAVSLAEVAR